MMHWLYDDRPTPAFWCRHVSEITGACCFEACERLRECQRPDQPPDLRVVPCEDCGTEGKIYQGQYEDERYICDCGTCEGTGGALIHTRPIDIDDLDQYAPPRQEAP